MAKSKARSNIANSRARPLLQSMFNLFIPLLRPPSLEITRSACRTCVSVAHTNLTNHSSPDLEAIASGIEADEFVNELEGFISGMVSRSQQGRKGISVNLARADTLDYLEGTQWLWDLPTVDEKLDIGIVAEYNPQGSGALFSPAPAVTETVWLGGSRNKDYGELQHALQKLQSHIERELPIRLLCFEPQAHESKLNITLIGRSDLYAYLYPRILADYEKASPKDLEPHVSIWAERYARYAILSHTWSHTPSELTHNDWRKGLFDAQDPKCQKVLNFSKVAWEDHGVTFGWIDTVCINKESSSELDESIRSMYKWYEQSYVCVTYLAGTRDLSDMQHDPWFTRGWTLQELVAPRCTIFYNKDWQQMSINNGGIVYDNNHHHPLVLECIEAATTITRREIWDIKSASISRRMELAARRKVTRPEDTAYSLMGIFNVGIPIAYGEGAEHAFFRLLKEIFDSTKKISDIFNWGYQQKHYNRQSYWASTTSLFATSPQNYLERLTDPQWRSWDPIKPLTLTHLGLRTPMLLMPSAPEFVDSRFKGPDLSHQPIGDYHAEVSLTPRLFGHASISVPSNYKILHQKFRNRSTNLIYTFGTLNVEAHGTMIRVPKTCLAVLLLLMISELGVSKQSLSHHRKVNTQHPIVFDLRKESSRAGVEKESKHSEGEQQVDSQDNGQPSNGSDGEEQQSSPDEQYYDYYEIEQTELESHGMRLVTFYL
ncbi:hypothetical protein BDN70DRAFT_825981 [Pholiota conissans]|uniref:Heterokaryon incompatibility domain-containing protein n=1 Tax=Pholiota conissans TaxID=109636 RepID=A0A9P5ZD52_9AGAR|nr:hypothetical protein BDN70DRAFT_825981 [Pholiota conissans]